MKKSGVRNVVDSADRAKRGIRDARARLRNASDVHSTLFPTRLQWARRLVEARALSLASYSGVVGFGLGQRLRKGFEYPELCLTVLVKKKRTLAFLRKKRLRALPTYFRSGNKRLRLDVVEMGEFIQHNSGGVSVGPRDTPSEGTVGVVARDQTTRRQVLVTAMHVSGLSQFSSPDPSSFPFVVPSARSGTSARVVGGLTYGTTRRVDAARIDVTRGTFDPRIPRIGQVRGWRPITFPSDAGSPVRLFGAVSGYRRGVIVHPAVDLPEFDLEAAILVDILTAGGDSGAALIDSENLLIGFLVGELRGRYDHLRVFSPASLVMDELNCMI